MQLEKSLTINEILSSYLKLSRCELRWNNSPITPEEIFSDKFLMPAITLEASARGMKLFEWDLDVKNHESKEGILGLRSEIPEFRNNGMADIYRLATYRLTIERIFGFERAGERGGIFECYPVYQFYKMDLKDRASQIGSFQRPIARHTPRISEHDK